MTDTVSIEFTAEELWMLHDFVRHDEDLTTRKRWPTVSTELNGQVALAIVACEDGGLKSYMLELTMGDMLLIDYHVRRDHKTPEGAMGRQILLKLFRARRDLVLGPTAEGPDLTYKQALHNKTVEAAAEVADEVIEEEVQRDASTTDDPDDGADEVAV